MHAEKPHDTILLIEADPWDSGLVEEAMAELGERQYLQLCPRAFQMIKAESLAEASDYLAEMQFDVILTDLNLPDSQALHTLVRLRAQSPQTPILVLCDKKEEALGIRAVREGAQDYLLKEELDGIPLARGIRHAIERQRMAAAHQRTLLADELTGSLNRDAFLLVAGHDLEITRRGNHRLTLLVAELDFAVELGDAFAHMDRDLALIDAGEILR